MTRHNKLQNIEDSTINDTENQVVISRKLLDYTILASVFLVIGIAIGLSISLDEYVEKSLVRDIVEQTLQEAGLYDDVDMVRLADDEPFIGREDAPIVMIEFSAYGCPYCQQHNTTTIEPILEDYGHLIRYVYRDFPVVNPQISESAALAANCAHEQDYFWEYHSSLYENQESLGNSIYYSLATDLGLDINQFEVCFEEQRYLEEIESDYFDGLSLGISGTPSFVINGRAVSGAMPYAFFERILEEEIEKLGLDV